MYIVMLLIDVLGYVGNQGSRGGVLHFLKEVKVELQYLFVRDLEDRMFSYCHQCENKIK